MEPKIQNIKFNYWNVMRIKRIKSIIMDKNYDLNMEILHE
jgi:hypothetical protein